MNIQNPTERQAGKEGVHADKEVVRNLWAKMSAVLTAGAGSSSEGLIQGDADTNLGEFRAEQTPTTTLRRDLKGHPACRYVEFAGVSS